MLPLSVMMRPQQWTADAPFLSLSAGYFFTLYTYTRYLMVIRTAILVLTIWAHGLCHPVSARQAGTWHIRGGAAYGNPDGHFTAQRANGKIVTSDIDGGILFSFRVEKQITDRLGITLGGLGGSKHHFIIHQDFPDDTEFEARDEFRFKAVTAGVALHYFSDKTIGIVLEPFLLLAWYNNVSLSSAGPPYDRDASIEVDVNLQPGLGLIANIEIYLIGRSVTINPWTGLAAVRFTGPYAADPSIPDSEGNIGVGFSPLMVGIALGSQF